MSKKQKQTKDDQYKDIDQKSVEEKAATGEGKDVKSGKKPDGRGVPGRRQAQRKGKGKSNPKTPRGSEGRRDDEDKSRPRNINDIRWYVKYPSIVTGSSSHIFNARLGHLYKPFDLTDTSASNQYIGAKQAIPGVVSLLWTPWFNMTGTETDAVNIASKNLYTYIRHANSGSVNYESSDLMQYILVVAELFAYAEQLKRDLKMIFTFKTTNIYLYKRVLWASGYTMSDVNDMINFYALYSNRLNIAISQLNSFKIPKEMSFLARHCWMASHAWKDDELDKATTYIYNMQGIYHYDWANGELHFNPLLPTLSSTIDFPARLAALEGEINNLLAYEDIGIMLGDILKAYGNDSCYFAQPLQQGEIYEAEYSSEVVHQIRNAIVTGGSYTQRIKQMPSNSQLLYETQENSAPSVVPVGTNGAPTPMVMDKGVFYFPTRLSGSSTTSFSYLNKDWIYHPYLVIDADNPTNEEIILNTRLMSTIQTTNFMSSGYVVAKLGEVGTEIIVSSAVVSYEATLQGGVYTDAYNSGALTTLNEFTGYTTVHILANQYKVDSIPQRVILSSAGGGGSSVFVTSTFYYGKNVISVEREWLELLHKGCKLSQFTIPMFKLLESSK